MNLLLSVCLSVCRFSLLCSANEIKLTFPRTIASLSVCPSLRAFLRTRKNERKTRAKSYEPERKKVAASGGEENNDDEDLPRLKKTVRKKKKGELVVYLLLFSVVVVVSHLRSGVSRCSPSLLLSL